MGLRVPASITRGQLHVCLCCVLSPFTPILRLPRLPVLVDTELAHQMLKASHKWQWTMHVRSITIGPRSSKWIRLGSLTYIFLLMTQMTLIIADSLIGKYSEPMTSDKTEKKWKEVKLIIIIEAAEVL